MARTGAKLWENAFQTIPDISFFDAPKEFQPMFCQNFSASNQEIAVLEEQRFFERSWQVRLEKLPPMNPISALYDFWRRGKKPDFGFFVDFSAKTDLQFLLCDDLYDNIVMVWSNDMV